ncbi:unnamed protein product [Amoebophrya sp. A25]|nr:unnamed protein product [Amoebophrya sp. A25]|eukprot:GSA25T00027165001.1
MKQVKLSGNARTQPKGHDFYGWGKRCSAIATMSTNLEVETGHVGHFLRPHDPTPRHAARASSSSSLLKWAAIASLMLTIRVLTAACPFADASRRKHLLRHIKMKWWDFCPANYCPEKMGPGDTRISICREGKGEIDFGSMGIDWKRQSGDGRAEFYKHGGNGQLAAESNHDLAKGTSFIDIGSYTGESVRRFADNNPQADVFTYEPTQQYFEILKKNTKPYKNIHAFNVGIGPDRASLCFKLLGDATQVVPPLLLSSSQGAAHQHGDHGEDVKITCDEAHGVKPGKILPAEEVFANFIKEGRTIDAIQINCEGCEYIVLQALMALSKVELPSSAERRTGMNAIELISRVDVQFHAVGSFRERYCEVFLEMSRHFDIKFNYDIVWTTFVRKRGRSSSQA